MRRGGQVSLAVLATALVILAVGAQPASAKLVPPKTWTGTVDGVNHAVPSVGTTTTWSADVKFKLYSASRKHRLYQYVGTGSVTYEIHGGSVCTSSGMATFPISGRNEGDLTLQHTRSGWRYWIEIPLIGEEWTAQVQCPDQPGPEPEQEYIPPPLRTDRKSRPVPRGLSSVAGTYSEGGGSYVTNWDYSGTPRRR